VIEDFRRNINRKKCHAPTRPGRSLGNRRAASEYVLAGHAPEAPQGIEMDTIAAKQLKL